MNYDVIMTQLETQGVESIKLNYMKHGAKEPLFGVKVEDLKKILKKTKKNHELSLKLYSSGNSDAMYLACLMADEKLITKEQIQLWVEQAYWYYLSEFAVPWVAAESKYGLELALEWINSENESIVCAGWSTLAYYAGIENDDKLDIKLYKNLLKRIENEINSERNRVKYVMNGFIISIATYIKELTNNALNIANQLDKISVDMNGTYCLVPEAKVYINKNIEKNQIGKKRKSARC